MADIREFIRQHIIINENIKAIECLNIINNFNSDAGDAIRIINSLANKLKSQIHAKAKFICLNMIGSGDEKAINTASEFMDISEDIHSKYVEYSRRFRTSQEILEDREQFRKETGVICRLLTEMMNKEAKVIYTFHKNQVRPQEVN